MGENIGGKTTIFPCLPFAVSERPWVQALRPAKSFFHKKLLFLKGSGFQKCQNLLSTLFVSCTTTCHRLALVLLPLMAKTLIVATKPKVLGSNPDSIKECFGTTVF